MNNMVSQLSPKSGMPTDFLGMAMTDFEILFQKIAPYITKKDTRFRKAIPAKIRLALTLRYLTSGECYKSLSNLFKISNQIISLIVSEVCLALQSVLMNEIKTPTNADEWLHKEAGFRSVFPHCLGIIDGKTVICLPNNTANLREYERTSNVVLITLIDSEHRFIYAEIACKGSIKSGCEEARNRIYEKLDRNALSLPMPSALPDSDDEVPYVFVADNAFSLHTNILKPYPEKENTLEGEVFNIRLSKVRSVANNVFRVISRSFQVLQKPITLQPDRAVNLIMSCVLLHNFLLNSLESRDTYLTPDFVDVGTVATSVKTEEQLEKCALRPFTAAVCKDAHLPTLVREQFAEHFAKNCEICMP